MALPITTPMDTAGDDTTLVPAGGDPRPAGDPLSLVPIHGLAGPGSPTKEQLKEEMAQLRTEHQRTLQMAEGYVEDQQARAKAALRHQDASFRRAAKNYEEVASDRT